MLWYKAWLETRGRFLICLIGMTWFCAYSIGVLAETRHTAGIQLAILWILAMNLTTMGGLLREKAVGATSFTLALPFSRAWLTGVRIATAFSQAMAMIVIPWAAIFILSSAPGKVHLLQQALLQLLCLIGGGVVYFAIALLASCLFEGEYTALVVSFGVVFYSSWAQPPDRRIYNPLAFMTERAFVPREGLLLGPSPWEQVAVYCLFAACLAWISVKTIEAREF